jgi:hypothetical protein
VRVPPALVEASRAFEGGDVFIFSLFDSFRRRPALWRRLPCPHCCQFFFLALALIFLLLVVAVG